MPHLGAMPMLMITGQKAIKSARQARFQIVDIVGAMRPLTKMTRQIVSGRVDPDHRARCLPRRDRRAARAGASRAARGHRRAKRPMRPLVPPHPIDRPVAPAVGAGSAAAMILAAKRPLIMIGAAGNRPRLVDAAVRFRAPHRHPVLQHADGQGRRDRRLQPLSGHGRACRSATMSMMRSIGRT